MISITPQISLDEDEIEFRFIRSPGPGGQNVNKLSTAVQLRFNISASSLPEGIQERLAFLLGSKLTAKSEIIIKAYSHRSQERNKQEALERLKVFIIKASIPVKKRKKTKPTLASKKRRIEAKKRQSNIKSTRQKPLI